VLISPGRDGSTTVIAIPTTEVTDALRHLSLVESIGAAALLVLLSIGSWLLLRHGLRPLEKMAATARSITAGDLSQRVAPSGGPSEVGQLGLALNTMLEDIEAAFAEREATELRLRQFLADASHELRTPLTSIQGFAELFRVSGKNARVDLPTILRRIEEESARMKVLVEDLLLLARLDQPRTAERAPVDLAVLAADSCSDAVATAPERRVTLDAPEPVVIAGDESHLRQAIANLVTNAVRHTPPATAIEVSAGLDDGVAVVSVRDHGAGLDDDAIAHVFDRFWQADRARVGTGAGLGLAIVSSIAAEHGGTATAANAPGGGAVFTLRLPLDGPPPRPAPAMAPMVSA
jgi:two-component system OmpR family sensor kinase